MSFSKAKRRLAVLLIPVAIASAISASTAGAIPYDAPWSGSGSGTTTVVNDGSTGPAVFSYSNDGPFTGSWQFKTTATTTGNAKLSWAYSGFHSFFRVRVGLSAFVSDGVTTTTYPLVNAGPVNCCDPPSAGFGYSGTVTIPVAPGNTYGFNLSGSHFDGTRAMRGTLTVDQQNAAPDCSAAAPSISSISLETYPDHQFVPVTINGVTDPDGDPTSLVVTGIRQDEATRAKGSGNTPIDGQGVGTSSAAVRAERVGSANGRVYHLAFKATDGWGASCTGEALVGVPHDDRGAPAVDGGALFDSTV